MFELCTASQSLQLLCREKQFLVIEFKKDTKNDIHKLHYKVKNGRKCTEKSSIGSIKGDRNKYLMIES